MATQIASTTKAPVTAAKATTPTSTVVVAKQGDTITDANGNKGIVNYDQKTGAKLGTGASTSINLGSSGKSSVTPAPVIVTSDASRSEFANNVNTLNNATSSIAGNQQTNGNGSVVDFLKSSKMPSDYNSRAQMAKQYGIQGYTGSSSQNTQLLGFLQSSKAPGDGVAPADPSNTKNITTTATQADPTATTGPTADPTASVSPEIKAQYDESLSQLDSTISSAKTTLEQAQNTLQNDPAAAVAVSTIMAKFDQQIEMMKEKNRMVLGGAQINSARSGATQYANEMDSNFMSNEQDRATSRISDIITQEMSAVLEATNSYKSKDLEAFNSATKALQSAQKEKLTAINDLLKATDTAIKNQQAQQKLVLDTQKEDRMAVHQDLQDILADKKFSADQKQQAVDNAFKSKTISETQRHNYQTEISSKNGNTQGERKTSSLSAFEQKMVQGATTADGTPIVDETGYITPKAWKEMLSHASDYNLTRSDFIKQFGSKIYNDTDNGIPNTYGLTAVEEKLITGTIQ